jgi:hypothetical protein
MRWVVAVVLLSACPAPEAKEPVPAGPTCKSAAEHMIDELVAGKDPRPPDDVINAQIKIIREHCEKDGWSEPARACFSRMRTLADADQCGTYLTAEQQAALAPPAAPAAPAE